MYLYIDSKEKRLGRQGKGVKGEGYGDMVKKQPVLVQYKAFVIFSLFRNK